MKQTRKKMNTGNGETNYRLKRKKEERNHENTREGKRTEKWSHFHPEKGKGINNFSSRRRGEATSGKAR